MYVIFNDPTKFVKLGPSSSCDIIKLKMFIGPSKEKLNAQKSSEMYA